MKIFNRLHILMALPLSLMVACNDDWDSHYERSGEVPEETVYQMIKADASLSTFGAMIDTAGYAAMLNTSQTFTVWAPANEALGTVDFDDVEEVRRTVSNHIARFNISTSTPATKGVRMYNGKVYYFEGTKFAGAEMTESDVIAKNGVLHRLSSSIPYFYNLREYIDIHENTSLISAFLKRFDEEKFDQEASTPIDVNEDGATVYDSVKIAYNRIFDDIVYGLGAISDEDSLFTMIIPDNEAWTKAYERIAPFFKVYNADAAIADSIQEVQTSLAIVNDLIYRAQIASPETMTSVESTSGSKITDVDALFAGAERIDASNGIIYLVSELNYNNVETWNKPIEIEAEAAATRKPAIGTTVYTRTVSTDSEYAPEISDLQYIEVLPQTSSTQPGVTFSMPNVLAGKYDIYATFVPAVAEDATATNDSTRVQFTLTYYDAAGKKKTKTWNDNSFITSPTQVTVIKVAEGWEFPASNFYDNLWLMDEANDASEQVINTTLLVKTNVGVSDFNKNIMTRRFRIDNIIFVPVQL